MQRFFLFISILFLVLLNDGQSQLLADKCHPRCRPDTVPRTRIAGMEDEYLTGYIQGLIDLQYYEFEVRVLVSDGAVYVFNLPRNELIAASILCFIQDIPCIRCVQPICCSCDEFICELQETDPVCAEQILESSAYASICDIPPRGCGVGGVWFPPNSVLFQPLVADPRQVTNAASIRFNDSVIGQHVGAVIFGDDFIFYRWLDVLRWHGDADIGIEAGVFSVFDLDHPQACMVNSDFYVALLLTYAVNHWSWRFRLWHLSSHLGDEFLLSNPGFTRYNVSDNGVDLFVSWQPNPALRIYFGLGDILWEDDEFRTKPFYIEWGSEIRLFGCRDHFNRLYVQPFLAMHFRSWQENSFNVDQTYTLGFEWSKLRYVGRKFRIFAEYHHGYCDEGQFVQFRSNYFALKTEFGF
ncbi:MAG: DUF1207 domain-containing protein [Verrucomicrobia bacterium]|nr:DUF1207 domain-containing protein [Verrucomicrobiota bacterium]